ncbi:hypothetical protein AeMF1_004751 [Aphanomyces euteiches]|nr:hypothetical protein AeMF1_004751 [Aphanomyces euteiches]KAH9186936.1 hypothetical protein AeNC1_011090 [Aphanomyces euteiches]
MKLYRWQSVIEHIGLLYVLSSVGLCIVCTLFITAYTQNNLFWPGYLDSGMQNALIDVFNFKLVFSKTTPSSWSLLTPTMRMQPNYNESHKMLFINGAYPRLLLASDLSTDLIGVIQSLRSLQGKDVMYLLTPYCWADFNRTWSMAHSEQRAQRCLDEDSDNAAVYLEATFRNIDFPSWSAQYDDLFKQTIASALAETPSGIAWLDYITAHQPKQPPNEALFWKQLNLTRFTTHWGNYRQTGLLETIAIENTMGVRYKVQIKAVPSYNLGVAWTSGTLYGSLENEMWAVVPTNSTLIRSSERFFGISNPNAIEMYINTYPLNYLQQILHDQMGPLGSYDMKLIVPPPDLLDIVAAFHAQLTLEDSRNPQFAELLNSIGSISVRPVPRRWSDPNLSFRGGSPLCASSGFAQAYIQTSFGFDDDCNTQTPYSAAMTGENILFQFVAIGIPNRDSCAIASNSLEMNACYDFFRRVKEASKVWNSSFQRTTSLDIISALNLSFMQFIQNSTSTYLDVQLILENEMELFGWIHIYEWAMGQREAVAFAGDLQMMQLLSAPVTPLIIYANMLDIRTTLALYLASLSTSVTSGLSLVAFLIVVVKIFAPPRRVGRNWLFFNRVASAVWLGRPMLLIRAATAIFCLSTCPVRLINTGSNHSNFVYQYRSMWESFLLAGESLWLSYVVNDLLVIVTRASTRVISPSSTAIAWTMIAALDIWLPVTFDAQVDRHCTAQGIDSNLFCESAVIWIGRSSRAILLASIHIASVSISTAFALWQCKTTNKAENSPPTPLIPGTAMALMDQAVSSEGYWSLDSVSAVMCGILSIRIGKTRYIIDTSLWLLLTTSDCAFIHHKNSILLPNVSPEMKIVQRNIGQDVLAVEQEEPHRQSIAKFMSSSLIEDALQRIQTAIHMRQNSGLDPASSKVQEVVRTGWIIIGFVHILISLISNVTFLAVTASAILANDFFWTDFNSTGTQSFLVNTLNRQLLTTKSLDAMDLTKSSLADWTQFYNGTSTTIQHATTKARAELYSPSTQLDIVVRNLRTADPCMLPWMFTQYCWVDFGKQWPMASTEARQKRCERNGAMNGARYLETVLRNMRSWNQWSQCWGRPFEIGIATSLRESVAGTKWLESTRAAALGVEDEVALWQSHNVSQIVLQWQNFKTLGMRDTFRVQNALKIQYDLTLSSSRGQFHKNQQTSMKMYWGFASDLWAVASNETCIAGLSLIRTSAQFAFANFTPSTLVFENQTVVNPLTQGFAALDEVVGPFGAVDMRYVLPPSSLTALYQTIIEALMDITTENLTAQESFLAIPRRKYIGQFPPALASPNISLMGGNLLCGDDMPFLQFTTVQSTAMYAGYSVSNMCHLFDTDYFIPDAYKVLFALWAFDATLNATAQDVQEFCDWDVYTDELCTDIYTKTLNFLANYTHTFSKALSNLTLQAQTDVTELNVEYTQYIMNESTALLYHVNVLDDTDRAWPFFGWCFLYSWVAGHREVVSFEGDAGSLAVFSARYDMQVDKANQAEIPHDLSLLLHVALMYITILFLGLAALVTVYTIASRGHTHGPNLLKFSRIVGLVWVGRTFLIIRSVSAMIIVDTSTLSLVQRGVATVFSSPPIEWYNLMLACMELQWLVFVLNDGVSFITRDVTSNYAGKSVWVAWAVVVVWTLVQPNQHAVSLHRICTAIDMDFELECDSGLVEIGSFTRVCISAGICLGSVLLSYGVVLMTIGRGNAVVGNSLLLSAQAKYLLDFSKWTYESESFLDRPTALMAGIVSFEWKGALYLFDIKKWRSYTVQQRLDNEDIPVHIRFAIPLGQGQQR